MVKTIKTVVSKLNPVTGNPPTGDKRPGLGT